MNHVPDNQQPEARARRRLRTRESRWCWPLALAGLATVAIAWYLKLWLVVLTVVSACALLVRQWVLTRRELPPRLAGWAVHAPRGPSPAVALEHAIAADLAAVAGGRLECLARAHCVVEDAVDDPWRRALATERLGMAEQLLAGNRLPGLTPRSASRAAPARAWAAAMASAVLVALGNSLDFRPWLAGLALANALLALECVGLLERRRALPQMLASRALQDPVAGVFVMPEQEVARSLAALSADNKPLLARAVSLLDRREHGHARHRLLTAQHLVAAHRRPSPRKSIAAWLLGKVLVPAGAATAVFGSWTP